MLGRSLSLKKKTSAADLGPVAQADGVPAAVAEEGAGEMIGIATDETYAPTGLVNDGNTCYLNSVFQSLIHTPPLSSLLVPLDCKDGPWTPPSTYPVDRQRSPAFMAERNEHRDLMPLAASFIESSGRSWRTELAGFEPQPGERKGQGLKTLLYTLSKKYDQYADYDQQDSHELLRHLLDSMRMEEVDVIKRIHGPKPAVSAAPASPSPPTAELALAPQPSPRSSADPAVLPPIETVNGDATSPEKKRSSKISFTNGPHKDTETQEPLVPNVVPEPVQHDMMSFVDMLFGGRLASMIVCETCKSVSHTYEDFMDLSMGIPQDEPKERKRDRFKALTQRLRGKSVSRPNDEDPVENSAVASDDEDEASDHKLFGARRLTSGAESNKDSPPPSRRGSNVGGNEGGANLGRRNSIFSGLSGLSLSRKKSVSSRRSSMAQSEAISRPSSPSFLASDAGDDASIPPLSSAPTLNSIRTAPAQFSNAMDPKFPKIKPSQAAYIRQILGTAPNPHPLASLHLPPTAEAAMQGWMGLPANTQNGLMDALRQFTSVEVLEGENSFACKKCWRWENPRKDGRPWRRGGETGNDASDDEDEDDPAVAPLEDPAPVRSSNGLEPLHESYASVPTSVETTPSGSAVDLTASIMSAPGSLPSASTAPRSPLAKTNISHIDTSFPDDPSSESLHPTMYEGQVIPTIATIPFSPENEGPPSLSTARASSYLNGADPTHLAAPDKQPRKVNLRPAASRGLSYTRHVNPAFAQDPSSGEDDFSDASSGGSFEGSSDDDASASSVGQASDNASGVDGEKSPERPAVTRKKSEKKRYIMRRAFKRYLIVNPPPILVLHLKRFELIQGRGFGFGTFAANFKKIDTPISFPLSIDVAPFLAPARIGAPVTVSNSTARKRAGKEVVAAVQYNLTAIVVHIGAMGSGHYVSYVLSSPHDPPAHQDPSIPQPPPVSDASSHRSHHSSRHSHSKDDKDPDPRVWWYCSDTIVKQVPVDEVLKARAYLLFFQKV